MEVTTLRIALRALGRNKVRSALTMLGVVIGVAAVIAMVAIGAGATKAVQRQIASMGRDMLTVTPGSLAPGAVHIGAGSAHTLTPRDAAAIARDCPSAATVSVLERARAQLVYRNLNWGPAATNGVSATYLDVRQWPLAEGVNFTEDDVRSAAPVCLLGRTVVDALFPDESAVGKQIRVSSRAAGMPFKVIGVLEKKGVNAFGADQDDVMLVPWSTCKRRIQRSTFDDVDQVLVVAESSAQTASLEDEVRATLRATHHPMKDRFGEDSDDFTIQQMTEIVGAMTEATDVMTRLLAGVAGVSLLVGGIGIMNIMLVSVTERTPEIGLRMAVGASGAHVLSQFLVESVALSGIGGLVGIAVGVGGAVAASKFADWPVVVSPQSIVGAAVFSCAVGVVFGFYPAWRASLLDPIDALRHE
jgi:putative ABC transport system permease protein